VSIEQYRDAQVRGQTRPGIRRRGGPWEQLEGSLGYGRRLGR